MYQYPFLLSIHPKPVDGFSRQRNCLPWFQYLASSALPSMFTTWQVMHTYMIWYLASRVCTYRFCKIARMSGWLFSTWQAVYRTGPARNFCTGSLGTPPKPRNHTSCELRVFCKTLRTIKSIHYNDLTCLFVKSRTAVIVNPAALMTRSTVLPKA